MAGGRFLHQLPEYSILIEQVSGVKRIRAQLVEKDYWIMHALWGLQNQGLRFELKGGTSLSKGFGIIDRFSEDIDIRIEPPEELHVKSGRNHDKPAHKQSRLGFYQWLTDSLAISGITTMRDTAFDDSEARNAGIRLTYKSSYQEVEGVKRFVLLEVGFDQTSPNEKRLISSWLYDAAVASGLDVKDNRAVDISCYLPIYTFVEKLDAISRKYALEQEGRLMPVNFIRHYYDVYQLLGHPSVLDCLGTREYIAHKAIKFKNPHKLAMKDNQAFVLHSQETREKYAREYKRTQALYYSDFPDFETLLERIQTHLPNM